MCPHNYKVRSSLFSLQLCAVVMETCVIVPLTSQLAAQQGAARHLPRAHRAISTTTFIYFYIYIYIYTQIRHAKKKIV